ncbi:ABC transporter permease [Thermasporomyces composti]|jgi:ABC-2 type transport system permease protein|uniref:ABC-2 type transport system permease protein n=1 Tax=Thermasporomyces composti TaxID=696763 RepID=A0A3D9V730_THECX|nr:ABC transporter permease [Thermasporomyces composti]REF36503.1 ABC-2 type transport system permease protein [Thermasporomyces composti]
MTEEAAPRQVPAQASIADPVDRRVVAGFGVRLELRRQLSRWPTRLAWGLCLALPFVLVAAFHLGDRRGVGEASFADLATAGAANFTVFTVGAAASFLLTVVVALLAGDTVASDASHGTLRYLLAVPVPRGRLLAVKLTVSVLTAMVALLGLVVTTYVVGTLAFGWRPLRTPRGDEMAAGEALGRIVAMTAYVALTLLVVAALAFLLSVSTDAPLAAVGGTVMVVVVGAILDQVTELGPIRALLPLHYADAWWGLFTDPIRLEELAKGGVSTLVYSVAFLVVAWWRFLRADIVT